MQSLLEYYAYQSSVRRSEYYDPAPASHQEESQSTSTGPIYRAYPKRCTMKCMNEDGSGLPLSTFLREYLSNKTSGMELIESCAV